MFYINSFHHTNTLVIISVRVDMASPSLLYRLSSCAKTSLTACFSIVIGYILILYLQFTLLFFVLSILYAFNCLLCVWQSFYYEFLPQRDYVTFGYLPSQFCLSSVCCLSVTFVHPTQPVEIFGNVSTPFCSLAILTTMQDFTKIVTGILSNGCKTQEG